MNRPNLGVLLAKLVLVCVFFNGELIAQESNQLMRTRYHKARQLNMMQDWQGAIENYRAMLQDDPDGELADDALFWLAFSLERLPDKQGEAFDVYQQLRDRFPQSTWADDALLNQIALAEMLARGGKKAYHKFLLDQLERQKNDVRYQAALSLGRLGDKKALPVLQEYATVETGTEPVSDIISNFKSNTPDASETRSSVAPEKSAQQNMRSSSQPQSMRSFDASSKLSTSGSGISFETNRYEQYRANLRTDDNWSFADLVDFGLWHILAPNDFKAYFSLPTRSAREVWLDIYWKKQDPSPTTPENEAREAFESRVRYARANFHEHWDNLETKYLKDQYLRSKTPHAPWDARGELYIKFGEPDNRTIIAWQTENWQYYRHNLDLMVKQYMTNIYGNAISATTINSRFLRNRYDRQFEKDRMEAQYVYSPVFEYFHDTGTAELKGVKFEESLAGNTVTIEYEIPLKEIISGAKNSYFYTRTMVLFDADMQEIRREKMEFSNTINEGDDDRVSEKLRMQLTPGKYRLSVRLEAPQFQKAGVYQFDIKVGD